MHLRRYLNAMDYSEVLQKLFSCPGRGSKTFEAAQKLDKMLGEPHRAFRSVHVAGTNGKGSVATKIAGALQSDGYRVGLYTSPHISSVRERIRVNGEMIPEEAVLKYLPSLFNMIEEDLSFFDLLTSLSFIFFKASHIDWAVVEVGLGGRFDATNVIDSSLGVITSIGYDHMAILGSTLEKIAKEKAGIVREGVPFIVGPSAAPFFPFADAVATPLKSFYDEENCAIARAALKYLGVSDGSIEKGLQQRPKCRFERIGDVILDVAHNPDGFQKLIEALQIHFPGEKFHFIVGFSKEKQWALCVDLIRPFAETIHFVGLHPRLIFFGKETLQEALAIHSPCKKVVCGSFYLMSEARALLGIEEPCDPEQSRGPCGVIDPAVMANLPLLCGK